MNHIMKYHPKNCNSVNLWRMQIIRPYPIEIIWPQETAIQINPGCQLIRLWFFITNVI